MVDNERRADLGADAVLAAAAQTNVHRVEDAHTAVVDVLSYVAHLCRRMGLEPAPVFDAGLHSWEGDREDGPYPEPEWDPTESLAVLMGLGDDDKKPRPVVVVTRHPDYDNEHAVFGDAEVHDIDMGRSDLRDPDTLALWQDSHRTEAQRYRAQGRHDVADHIEQVVGGVEA